MGVITVVRATSESAQAAASIATRHLLFCKTLELLECDLDSSMPHDEYDHAPTEHFLATDDRLQIGTARLILAPRLADLPTGRLLGRLEFAPPVLPGVRYSEPSRVGLFPDYTEGKSRLHALLRLAGCLAETSVEAGRDYFLISMLPNLRRSLPWFPWELAEYPILYPPEEGGPRLAVPIWLATMNLHDLVKAARMRPGRAYDMMFPQGTPWYDERLTKTESELKQRVSMNRSLVSEHRHESKHLKPLSVV